MGQLDDAWAAGFIDGEGCITIKRRKPNGYALWLVVGQSGEAEPEVLRRLASLYGGAVHTMAADTRTNRRPRWNWTIASKQAEDCLRMTLPYLIGKREQAEEALAYRENALGRGNGGLAEAHYLRLRELKRA